MEQLTAAATIAAVVEELANVAVITETKSSANQAQENAPTGSAGVAEDVQAS